LFLCWSIQLRNRLTDADLLLGGAREVSASRYLLFSGCCCLCDVSVLLADGPGLRTATALTLLSSTPLGIRNLCRLWS
jgi:hypothetical protein